MSSEEQAGNSVTRLPWPEQFEALAERSKSPILKAFYESGCVSPETPMSDVPFVALDFETTGLDASQHSIVSIGLVPFTLDGIDTLSIALGSQRCHHNSLGFAPSEQGRPVGAW